MITTRASRPTDRLLIPLLVLLATVPGPRPARASPPAGSEPLIEVASSGRRWTGVAVGPGGRIFVNFPRA